MAKSASWSSSGPLGCKLHYTWKEEDSGYSFSRHAHLNVICILSFVNLLKSRGVWERSCLTVHETWEWNCSKATISQRRVRSTQLSNTGTCKLPPSGMENVTNKNINFDWAFDGAWNYCRRVQLLIMTYPHPHCHLEATSCARSNGVYWSQTRQQGQHLIHRNIPLITINNWK